MMRTTNSRKRLALIVMAALLVAISNVTSLSRAQGPTRKVPTPNSSLDAQSTTGPTPPPGVNVTGELSASETAVTISGVPAYYWHLGCGPTAAGMVIGYWDGHGFDDLAPGDVFTQTDAADEMIASEGPASNYSDYCEPLDYSSINPQPLPDKSEDPPGDEHADDSVADYMKTSQSYYSNYYGWSWFSAVGPAMKNYASSVGQPGYSVTTRNLYMRGNPTLTWDNFRAEIDAGRPVVLLVDSGGDGITDHFVTAIGYDVVGGAQEYACLNSWDSSVHRYNFVPLASGQQWGIYGAVTFKIMKLDHILFLPSILRGG
jgi:Peptidase_C39 like family